MEPVCTKKSNCWNLEFVAIIEQWVTYNGKFETLQHEQLHVQINNEIVTTELKKLIPYEQKTYTSEKKCMSTGWEQVKKITPAWCSYKHVLVDGGVGAAMSWALCKAFN